MLEMSLLGSLPADLLRILMRRLDRCEVRNLALTSSSSYRKINSLVHLVAPSYDWTVVPNDVQDAAYWSHAYAPVCPDCLSTRNPKHWERHANRCKGLTQCYKCLEVRIGGNGHRCQWVESRRVVRPQPLFAWIRLIKKTHCWWADGGWRCAPHHGKW